MEILPSRSERPGDSIHRPPELAILPHNQGLEPPTDPMGSRLANLNFKIVYCPGSRGGKPDALSRRPEYWLEEGATHRE